MLFKYFEIIITTVRNSSDAEIDRYGNIYKILHEKINVNSRINNKMSKAAIRLIDQHLHIDATITNRQLESEINVLDVYGGTTVM